MACSVLKTGITDKDMPFKIKVFVGCEIEYCLFNMSYKIYYFLSAQYLLEIRAKGVIYFSLKFGNLTVFEITTIDNVFNFNEWTHVVVTYGLSEQQVGYSKIVIILFSQGKTILTCVRARVRARVHARVRARAHVRARGHVHACVRVCGHVRACGCTCVRTCLRAEDHR